MTLKKLKDISIQEELERRVLHGLVCEWENAVWILDVSVRDRLPKPMFSLRDMKTGWAYWSGEKKEICMSRNLVLKHSWDSVREILLHEMAHQLAEQIFKVRNEAPHGPIFKQACRLLRANPRASGGCVPLDKRVLNDLSGPEDKIMVRVRKLMSLAKSRNRHEAEAAMAKAHELIARHNVDLLARNGDRSFVSVFVGAPALRHFREDYHLSGLLLGFYFVYGIWVPAYVVKKGKMGSVLEISGTPKNVRIASYIHEFIKRFIDSQWQNYNKEKGLNRYRKTDFAVGIIEGFRAKLELKFKEQRKSGNRPGLIKIQDPLLQEHVDYKYPHTAGIRRKALMKDIHVMKDGMSAGKKLVISKGISYKGEGERLLIGNKK
ncbi:MAG: DUF2786 domain-containing protein [Desulfobacterales bacterium]|nr:DUF2786 domain-containing protein [Desulfobacterales bacterium]